MDILGLEQVTPEQWHGRQAMEVGQDPLRMLAGSLLEDAYRDFFQPDCARDYQDAADWIMDLWGRAFRPRLSYAEALMASNVLRSPEHGQQDFIRRVRRMNGRPRSRADWAIPYVARLTASGTAVAARLRGKYAAVR